MSWEPSKIQMRLATLERLKRPLGFDPEFDRLGYHSATPPESQFYFPEDQALLELFPYLQTLGSGEELIFENVSCHFKKIEDGSINVSFDYTEQETEVESNPPEENEKPRDKTIFPLFSQHEVSLPLKLTLTHQCSKAPSIEIILQVINPENQYKILKDFRLECDNDKGKIEKEISFKKFCKVPGKFCLKFIMKSKADNTIIDTVAFEATNGQTIEKCIDLPGPIIQRKWKEIF